MAASTARATQRPRARRGRVVAAAALVAATIFVPTGAYASHPEASLPGSNFEIDINANLKVDDPAPSIDWASVNEARKNDLATGTSDDSYAGGTKEDDACPGTTTGSIPNNKSDLLTFGAYVEPEAGGAGFLNLFWTRVQEPSGTTLMDFELNQSSTLCANGVNPVRTAGDLLIEYRIEQGGAVATIKVRTWTGTVWGPAVDLTAAALAAGTINSTPIPAGEADGLGALSARTFGEAQLDLDFIFDSGQCESFGNAFLKSRASDSFASQLKDFIKPVPVNITNCGTVIIHKVTDPASDPTTTRFGYTKTFGTDPASANTFSLGHGESTGQSYKGNVLFGSGYTVTEDSLPAGWDLAGIDCGASVGVTPSISGATITFAIDNSADILDCTYTNRARGTIIVAKETTSGQGSFEFTSNTLTPAPFTLTTTAAGQAGRDSETFGFLAPGTYDVAETVPAGWNLTSSTCSDGSDPASIGLSPGETVTCLFVDDREKGAIKITKNRKHAADGSGDHPHPGVVFTVTGGELPAGGVTATTDANGVACVSGLVLSSLVGSYTVTETVPTGYRADSPNPQTVSVDTEATCGGGGEATASFHNTPLTDLSVSVDSQVNGGTASTIECKDQNGTVVASGSTSGSGDGSAGAGNLPPGTYTCTVVVDP
jgi:hypothetical protein